MGRTVKSFSFDAKKKSREVRGKRFEASTVAERNFARQLKKVARAAGAIVDAHARGAEIVDEKAMTKALQDYAKALGPWAARQSEKMLAKVAKDNKVAYKNQSKHAALMQVALKENVAEAAVGRTAAALIAEQVALIQSIPLEAGLRAQRIARDNFLEGRRAKIDPDLVAGLLSERRANIEGGELEEEMERSTEVAVNRAKMIARTETARANSAFVQARASALGVTHYIWRNSGDGNVRPAHLKLHGKNLDGQVFAWVKPPTLDDGTTGHPGTFPNCRCYPEPILPDE